MISADLGCRAFRRTTLEKIVLDRVDSGGCRFQVDMALWSVRAGLNVVEVPIDFVERELGIGGAAMRRVTRWGLRTALE